ncbi:hypothetical protein GXN76_09600 [Kroppenstedtia pulmonis]|uniref:DNA2/NAM7 helicase-like C-terminal domain-containing protein n=1 Tax=Kroppenstedtia pulmonis TaxID=1380685 RepID=A0A7D3YA51_9BACL|nr:AAA domain-containing protein [Kroppenstedtia pulmonis]QKG84701.1 hypothetical protein GXN76_09600 [Kroppenstedtia pulmonis]
MSVEKNLLAYFFRSFQDQDISSFKRNEGIHISDKEFRTGELSKNSLSLIREKMKDPDGKMELHICLVFLEHNDNPNKILTPLFIPTQLEEERLLPISDRPPYIPRQHLEPTAGDHLVLGSLEKLDSYMERNSYSVEGNWNRAIEYAEKLFNYVIDDIQRFSIQDYRRSNQIWVVPRQEGMKHKDLNNMYRRMLGSEEIPPLLNSYLSLNEEPKVPVLNPLTFSERHLGQMNNSYPLSKGQRESMHHFFTLNEGEMLAVNGPPGTGKTTLLQNVVASLWVEAAVNGADDPPVVVATSANNKAITNIIDSFAQTGEQNIDERTSWGKKAVNLKGRWLPDLWSYGLYLPSNTKMIELSKSNHHYQVVSANSENFMDKLESVDRFPELKRHFLEKCSLYTKYTVDNLRQALEILQNDLVKTCEIIQEGVYLTAKKQEHHNLLERKYKGSLDCLIRKVNDWQDKVEKKKKEVLLYEDLKKSWNDYQNQEPLWWSWLSFLPGIKKRKVRRIESFLLNYKDLVCISANSEKEVTLAIDNKIQQFKRELKEVEEKYAELDMLHGEVITTQEQLRLWREKHDVKEDNVIEGLDTTLRFMAFQQATHYWEVKWLLEVEEQIHNRYQDSKSSRKTMKRWRRYAKLTPCFVATFYRLPQLFQGRDPRKNGGKVEFETSYLTEFIDLLIIDEAGQVPPGLAVPAFSLAKKALVVGDTMQIEPISQVTSAIDQGNLLGCKVIHDLKEASDIEEKGVTAVSGSVMKIAQRRSKYQKMDMFGGMFLAEHRRCVPEIIEYCNLIAYKGVLNPKRDKELKYNFLPHLGYAHIGSDAKEVSGRGKFNLEEAEAIVLWVKKHKDLIEKISKKKIEDVLGIITPFRYQTALIRQFLKELGMSDITVGTVHALQGAEKDIIIFSPVIGSKKGKPFYDRNPNMLNVAVSRAKDSFLVFGNMDEFGLSRGSPSHILKSMLYKKENEIQNIPRESNLFGHVAKSLRKRSNSQAGDDRTIVQHIVNIYKNEGQVILAQDQGQIIATQNIKGSK